MNETILKLQKKIYNKAKYSNKKKRFKLKEKHLIQLQSEVFDYVEEILYVKEWDKLNEISYLLTIGLIEEVLREVNVKND